MLARAFIRSRMIPICWSCGAWKVMRSRSLQGRDLFPLLCLLIPVRCHGCLQRFYALRGVEPQSERPAWQTENRTLRYVDENSTMLALIYAMFGPEGHRPTVRLRMKLPLRAAAIPPLVETERLEIVSTEHAEQLSNLLDALVAGHEPVSPEPPALRSRKRRRRRAAPSRTQAASRS